MKAIEEIIRTIRVGGTALVYVWALEQEKQFGPEGQQDVMVDWNNQMKYDKSDSKKGKKAKLVNHEKKTGAKFSQFLITLM